MQTGMDAEPLEREHRQGAIKNILFFKFNQLFACLILATSP
jgi:hypothetical protein